ncbi:putative bifunctional diguanylate cyclase/phosphodiesterase [Actinoplanes sp. NPDC051343]|uniref:putative bifunctional diguanylate cyclase/phosphodiesterase n=1 Tax=Actinoplanes sp. NPDC051343 TaxID=3363906 RepID=UPI0037946B6F
MQEQQTEMDAHTADYWARQLRIGTWVAVFVTSIGGVRIALNWPPSRHFWLVPVVAVVLLQAAALRLPWARLVQHKNVRNWLLLWWFGELPVLLLFGLNDRRGLMLYLPGAVLLLLTAAALWSPAVVVVLGAASVLGYCVLLPAQAATDVVTTVVLVAMMICVVGLTAVNAQSRRRLDRRRTTAEQRTVTLLEASADAVLAIGEGGYIRFVSSSVQQLLGYPGEQLLGTRIGEYADPEQLDELRAWMYGIWDLPDATTRRTETRLRGADGEWVYVDVIGRTLKGDPEMPAVVISLRDIGARRALEAELQRQAFTDPLTGMPNRSLFREKLEQAVTGVEGRPVTLLLLDLDDFKLVNDNLGHSAGDELLATIAERLRAQVRPGDMLARLGGDEFAILMEDLAPSDAAALAARLLTVVREPIRLASRDVICTLSIGIASVTGGDGVTDEQLLGNADLAMYAAKRAGRNAYRIFEPTMTMSVLEEAQQRADLEHALEHDEFLVLYQPVVDMHTQRLTGVEALVRWQHPRDGLLGPYHFIAHAEANGLIVPLGRWVLRQATQQLAYWRTESPEAAADLRMNVNLSARQFQYAGLVDDVRAAIADAGIDSASLTLEITESMLMADIESAKETLHSLRRLGVRLAIDDFGTGYSSLSYLKQLPVDIIKIDKTFVDQVDTDADDVALVDAVVGLGQALKMQTVAEGIETDGQWAMLRRIGIDHGQGYLFGRPSSPEDIYLLLDDPAAKVSM